MTKCINIKHGFKNRTCKAEWYLDMEQDLKTVHGIDITKELSRFLSNNEPNVTIISYKEVINDIEEEKSKGIKYAEYCYQSGKTIGVEYNPGMITIVKEKGKILKQLKTLTYQKFTQKYFVEAL